MNNSHFQLNSGYIYFFSLKTKHCNAVNKADKTTSKKLTLGVCGTSAADCCHYKLVCMSAPPGGVAGAFLKYPGIVKSKKNTVAVVSIYLSGIELSICVVSIKKAREFCFTVSFECRPNYLPGLWRNVANPRAAHELHTADASSVNLG